MCPICDDARLPVRLHALSQAFALAHGGESKGEREQGRLRGCARFGGESKGRRKGSCVLVAFAYSGMMITGFDRSVEQLPTI